MIKELNILKTIRIESSVKIPLVGGKEGEKGEIKLILEIPYSGSLFNNWHRAEELAECLTRGKDVLRNKGIKADQNEEVFVNIERQIYKPILEQLVNYLASTQTTGAISKEILLLLRSHLEQARLEANEIIKIDAKEAEKNS